MQMKPEGLPRARGFTLLEVMVALAIVAVALVALIRLVASGAQVRSQMETRTLAHWVGVNRVAALRAGAEWPAPGMAEGSAEQAGRLWTWRQEVSVTADPSIREIRVRVSDEQDRAVSLIAAYLAQPPGAKAVAN